MPTNDSQAFRTDEAVDISSTTDVGYYVGWTSAGEYLRYTVNVDQAGEKKPNASSYVGSPLDGLVFSTSEGNRFPFPINAPRVLPIIDIRRHANAGLHSRLCACE